MTEKQFNSEVGKGLKEMCLERLKEVQKVAEILGYETKITNLPDGLPTILIGVEVNYKDEDTITTCTFLPLELHKEPYLALQYNVIMNATIPEGKEAEVDEFINMFNRRFLLGTLVSYDNELSTKYSMYVNFEKPLEQAVFARTLNFLTAEADELLKKYDRFIEGKVTLKELEEEKTFTE